MPRVNVMPDSVEDLLFLEFSDVLDLHSFLLEKYGGLSGLRSEDSLRSAIATPLQTFYCDFSLLKFVGNGSRAHVSSYAKSSF